MRWALRARLCAFHNSQVSARRAHVGRWIVLARWLHVDVKKISGIAGGGAGASMERFHRILLEEWGVHRRLAHTDAERTTPTTDMSMLAGDVTRQHSYAATSGVADSRSLKVWASSMVPSVSSKANLESASSDTMIRYGMTVSVEYVQSHVPVEQPNVDCHRSSTAADPS